MPIVGAHVHRPGFPVLSHAQSVLCEGDPHVMATCCATLGLPLSRRSSGGVVDPASKTVIGQTWSELRVFLIGDNLEYRRGYSQGRYGKIIVLETFAPSWALCTVVYISTCATVIQLYSTVA